MNELIIKTKGQNFPAKEQKTEEINQRITALVNEFKR